MDESERGVSVSLEHEIYEDADFLEFVRLEANRVTITTQASKYDLDVSRVDPEEVSELIALIGRMNFDNRFRIEVV